MGSSVVKCDEFSTKVKRPHFSVLDKTKVKETFGVSVPYWKVSLRRCIDELARIASEA